MRDRRRRHRLAVAHLRHLSLVSWRSASASFRGSTFATRFFGSSAALGSAYGLAVCGVMVIASFAMIRVALRQWGWSSTTTALVWGPLTALNSGFLVASSLKQGFRMD